jgi:magnesium chelatase family protein
MLIKVYGSAVFGVEATNITVEVNVDSGIGYHLVGLPDNAIKESSFRIQAALKNITYNRDERVVFKLRLWCSLA